MKGWRTLLVSALLAAFGAVQAIDDPTDPQAWVNVAFAAVFAALRWKTDTPVGKGSA